MMTKIFTIFSSHKYSGGIGQRPMGAGPPLPVAAGYSL